MKSLKFKNEDVYKILTKISENGYQAYLVGGCVRDKLLANISFEETLRSDRLKNDEQIHDYDITTSATPQQIKKIFEGENIIDTGIQHGTVTLMFNEKPYEITTFRSDGDYLDYRHPDKIEFSDNIEDDLKRRDFTINSLALTKDGELIDLFCGYEDLKDGVIRCVGDPNERFKEDPLRIMRALRFYVTLNTYTKIDQNTELAIMNNFKLLNKISKERIVDELCKIFSTANFSKLEICLKKFYYVFSYIIPELALLNKFQNNPHHMYDNLYDHTVATVSNEVLPDKNTRLAALFHDIGKADIRCISYSFDNDTCRQINHYYNHPKYSVELAEKILKDLKFSNKDIDDICFLIRNHDYNISPENTRSMRKLLARCNCDYTLFERLIKLIYADKQSHNPSNFPLIEILSKAKKILAENNVKPINKLVIDGTDIMKHLNIKESCKIVGLIKDKLVNMVIDGYIENKKDVLLKKSEQLYHILIILKKENV